MLSNSPRPHAETFWSLGPVWADAFAQAGFDVASAVPLDALSWLEDDVAQWRAWLAEGAHAEMHFMEKNEEARGDPHLVLEQARSAVVVLASYAAGRRVASGAAPVGLASHVARYARGDDYHKVLKRRLDAVAAAIRMRDPAHFALTARSVIDSVPFFDRAFAREAGLGFVGKNTMFIRPGLGSYFFVATLLTDASVDAFATPRRANAVNALDCGECSLCLDACPTGALPRPYFLDARRCLSYLTIEHRDVIPDEYLPHFQGTLYGCDVCQEVCPYNLTTRDLTRLPELTTARPSLATLEAYDVASMSERQYEVWFGGMAITRAKYGGLVRNALCALHANRDQRLAALIDARARDPEPLIARTCAQLARLNSRDVSK